MRRTVPLPALLVPRTDLRRVSGYRAVRGSRTVNVVPASAVDFTSTVALMELAPPHVNTDLGAPDGNAAGVPSFARLTATRNNDIQTFV